MKTHEAGKIAVRFTVDLQAIRRQVDFQRRQADVFVHDIAEHNKLLTEFNLQNLPERDFLGLPPHTLDSHEKNGLLPHIAELMPKLDRIMIGISNELVDRAEKDSQFYDFELADDSMDDLQHWTRSLQNSFTSKQIIEQSDEELLVYADRSLSKTRNNERESTLLFERAISDAKINALNDQFNALFTLKERFEEYRLISDSEEPSAPLGVMRQAFIAMMASFDAAVLDLVRAALNKDFFRLIAKTEKKLTIELGSVASWEELQDSFVDAQLRKHYTAGWLRILNYNWGVLGDKPEKAFRYSRITEQIQRRNVHLHNRGLVDERYTDGVNPDDLAIGDFAKIDDEYWQQACTLNERLLRHIVGWVHSLRAKETADASPTP